MNRSIGRKVIACLLAVEMGALFALSFGFYCYNSVAGYSALAGGLIFLVPNAYFTFYAFRYLGLPYATVIASSLYRGQAGKFALAATGFALVFQFVRPLDMAVLFGVFATLLVLHVLCASKVCHYVVSSFEQNSRQP